MVYNILLVAGGICLLVALYLLKKTTHFLKHSERAVARVSVMERVSDSDGDTYKPVFTFKTSYGREITYRYPVSSSPATWVVNEEAIVAYDAGDPENAKLLTYWGSFSWPVILMAIAMPLLVIGGGYYLSGYLLK